MADRRDLPFDLPFSVSPCRAETLLALPDPAIHPRRSAAPSRRSAIPWVLAVAVVLALLGLLTAQLVLLRAQLLHVSSQDRVSKTLLSRADPALAPLPATLRQLAPVLNAVRGSEPARTARLARALAAQSAPVLSALTVADLPSLFNQVRGLVLAATGQNRLATALDAGNSFFAEVRQANLVEPLARAAALLPAALGNVQEALTKLPSMLRTLKASKRTQDSSLSVQRQSLAIQRQTLALLQQSLAVQQELLQHARSLDSKIP